MSTDFDSYKEQSHLSGLDGLRAISALLVIANHSQAIQVDLAGWVGVWIFYSISGYLITTLLLREEERFGGVSLRGFYKRRFFRIVPAYLATIALYGLASLTMNQGEHLASSLPYLLTFTTELAGDPNIMFGHAWTLGVEEKFYIALPLLGFVLLRGRRRIAVCVAALILPVLSGSIVGMSYFGLLIGALVAQIMNHRRGFEAVAAATRGGPPAFAAVLISVILVGRMANASDVHTPYWALLSLMAVYLVVQGVIHGGAAWLNARPLVYLGQRSYGIYLLHVLALNAAALITGDTPGLTIALGLLFSVGLAEAMYRTIEAPAIRFGRARAPVSRPT